MFVPHPLSVDTTARLHAVGLDPAAVEQVIRAALVEDLADGVDVTSVATIPADQRCVVTFVARETGVIAGLPVVAAVVEMVCGDASSDIDDLMNDGDGVAAGSAVARVTAPTGLLLTAERSALNLLCHLSGIATQTARWVTACAGTGAVVRDTRKTLPGLRALQKYAVRCGGGVNHRMGLFDAAMVKDNHIHAVGSLSEAVRRARSEVHHLVRIEVEARTLDEVEDAAHTDAEVILLDNFDNDGLQRAIALARGIRP